MYPDSVPLKSWIKMAPKTKQETVFIIRREQNKTPDIGASQNNLQLHHGIVIDFSVSSEPWALVGERLKDHHKTSESTDSCVHP